MAEYHYKYTPSGNDQRPDNNKKNDKMVSWILIAILLCTPVAPLGVLLLVMNLVQYFNNLQSKPRQGDPYRYAYSAPPSGAPQKSAASAAPGRSKKPREGQGLIVTGSILTGIFGVALLSELLDAISWGGVLSRLSSLGTLACFLGLGLGLLFAGAGRRKKARLFRKYLALIGPRDTVNITTLSKAVGRSYKKVCDDLQDMLDQGVLPVGYLDLSNDKLVLSAQGIADEPAEAPKAEEIPADDDDILREIKAVNDSIPDPVMTAKIDRIGEITGKILDYQRKNPDKAGQLRGFLNYYLPTTLKILRAYAQLDQQGIEGENISAAKARIEGMMDKVVEGFEKQLDKLFQDDALDITSDVAVLEKMLDKDGLGQSGMTLGA